MDSETCELLPLPAIDMICKGVPMEHIRAIMDRGTVGWATIEEPMQEALLTARERALFGGVECKSN